MAGAANVLVHPRLQAKKVPLERCSMPPRQDSRARPSECVGSDVSEHRELVAASIPEQVARTIRDLDRARFGPPSSSFELANRRVEVVNSEDRKAARRGPMIRDEKERAGRDPKRRDLGAELFELPNLLGPEDVAVVREILFEAAGSDVEVLQLTERSFGALHGTFIQRPLVLFQSP